MGAFSLCHSMRSGAAFIVLAVIDAFQVTEKSRWSGQRSGTWRALAGADAWGRGEKRFGAGLDLHRRFDRRATTYN